MIDGITSSTEFPPKEAPRPSVVERLRAVWLKFEHWRGHGKMTLVQLSRRNFDEWWREVDGKQGILGGRHGMFMGVQLGWVAERTDDSCMIVDDKGVFYEMPF